MSPDLSVTTNQFNTGIPTHAPPTSSPTSVTQVPKRESEASKTSVMAFMQHQIIPLLDSLYAAQKADDKLNTALENCISSFSALLSNNTNPAAAHKNDANPDMLPALISKTLLLYKKFSHLHDSEPLICSNAAMRCFEDAPSPYLESDNHCAKEHLIFLSHQLMSFSGTQHDEIILTEVHQAPGLFRASKIGADWLSVADMVLLNSIESLIKNLLLPQFRQGISKSSELRQSLSAAKDGIFQIIETLAEKKILSEPIPQYSNPSNPDFTYYYSKSALTTAVDTLHTMFQHINRHPFAPPIETEIVNSLRDIITHLIRHGASFTHHLPSKQEIPLTGNGNGAFPFFYDVASATNPISYKRQVENCIPKVDTDPFILEILAKTVPLDCLDRVLLSLKNDSSRSNVIKFTRFLLKEFKSPEKEKGEGLCLHGENIGTLREIAPETALHLCLRADPAHFDQNQEQRDIDDTIRNLLNVIVTTQTQSLRAKQPNALFYLSLRHGWINNCLSASTPPIFLNMDVLLKITEFLVPYGDSPDYSMWNLALTTRVLGIFNLAEHQKSFSEQPANLEESPTL